LELHAGGFKGSAALIQSRNFRVGAAVLKPIAVTAATPDFSVRSSRVQDGSSGARAPHALTLGSRCWQAGEDARAALDNLGPGISPAGVRVSADSYRRPIL